MKRFVIRLLLNCFFTMLAFSGMAQEPAYRNYTASDGLPSNNVYSVMQDSKGFVWFATDNGASRFDGTHFKHYSTADGLTDDDILKIVEDAEGRIWFLTFNGNLSFYQDNKIYNNTNCTLLKKIKFKDYITAFFQDSKMNIWIASHDLSLVRISVANEVKKYNYGCSFTTIWEDKKQGILLHSGHGIFRLSDSSYVQGLSSDWRPVMLLPGDTTLLIGTLDKGLMIADLKCRLKPINSLPGYNAATVLFTSRDDDDNTWMGTLDGVLEFDKSIISKQQAHYYFKNYPISSMLKDRDKNLWFSSLGLGVFMIPSRNIILYDEKSGLAESNITSFARINDSLLIIGTFKGNVQLINNNSIKNYKQPLITVDGKVLKIEKGLNDDAWLLTNYSIYNYHAGKYIKIKNTIEQWNKSLFIDNDDTLWIGWGRGLKKFVNGSFIVYWDTAISRVYAISQVNKSELLLGTDKGLYLFKNNKFIADFYNNPLLKHRIKALTITSDSTLWVGTDGNGLLSIRNNIVKQYSIKDHLLSNHCNDVFANGNKVYLATNNGLNVVSKKNESLQINSFSTANGLVSNHINQVGMKDKHTIILATDHGLVEFDERKILPSYVSTPYINSFEVNDSSLSAANNYNFKYNENNIRLDFGAINFNSAGNIYYRYKLKGVDADWNYTTATSVKYSYLHPGKYIFLVAAQNTDGTWSPQTTSITFNIQTPWWQTWWFRTAFGLSLIAIIYLITRWRISVYKQQVNRERALAESELKALRAQINPHFIYNSLNAIQDFILQNQKEDANLYLSKFATLMRNILSHSRTSSISLEEEIASLQLYLELEALRFNNKFTFQFIVDKNIDTEYVRIPSMILQPYIENAILHGLAPLATGGKISIGFCIKNNFLVSTIEDNGIGRKKAAEARKQRVWKGHKSLGMTVTQERIDLMSSHQKEKINMEITDLVDDTNNAAGTRVTIYFPLQG